VFLNITGGIRVNDPAIDLAVIVAVLSSNLDIPVPEETCFAGEVGLSGEIRPVPRIEQRIREASKLGFGRIVISKYHKTANLPKEGTEIIRVGKIADLVKILFA
jgi:DNA repair protein RadA/Sms